MALSDTAIRAAKPRATQYKVFDERGLFLLVRPTGSKLWQFRYRYLGKEQLASFGPYPDVGLKDARRRRDEARDLLAKGGNPSLEKKRAAVAARMAAAQTFELVAEEFIAKREQEGVTEITAEKSRWLLRQLKPIANRPIAEIEPFELLDVLKKVERSGRRETAKRMRSFAGRVFRYAIATARAREDVARDLRDALVAPKVTHHAAVLKPKAVGGLLRAIDSYEGHAPTKWALQLAPHVFVRPGELRAAEWGEIDLEKAVWHVPASRMKMRRDHHVPLSKQVIALFKEVQALTGDGRFVFPSLRTNIRPMSENTLNGALRRLGFSSDEMTAHGFRSMASTLLNESGKWSVDAIERALAHGDASSVRGAYHRGDHWDERVRMAQWWSDHLDALRIAKMDAL